MTTCLHISDTHGRLDPLDLEGVDLIVHSGDFLPSFSWGDRQHDTPRQREWLYQSAARIRDWTGGLPVLHCQGNHDFFSSTSVESILRDNGCKWTDITNRSDEIAGLVWYGLPWVPQYGTCNYGCELDELYRRTEDALRAEPDILVAHCPPWGVLDLSAGYHPFGGRPVPPEHIGNPALTAWLMRDDVKRPAHILCGHVHESHGYANVGATAVSNAATTQHRIVLP